MVERISHRLIKIGCFAVSIGLLIAASVRADDTPPIEKLLSAAAKGDRELADRLLETDLDINARGKAGMTALQVARIRGQSEMAST